MHLDQPARRAGGFEAAGNAHISRRPRGRARGRHLSALRARCPDCRTFTAVAVGASYECHACGREFSAGLVRVPRAWGADGEAMADGANLLLPYPETAVVAKGSLAEQTNELAAVLSERPLVLGGCCCAHVGAVQGLVGRANRLAVVWIDAHGDLNTPETSPSGNLWGMPLRMLLDDGVVAPEDVALVGARSLDPPEQDYLEETGIDDSLHRALQGADAVYVALDLDVLDPADVEVFVPEPGGPPIGQIERVLRDAVSRVPLAGIGVTGQVRDDRNIPVVSRLLAAAGL